MRSTPSLRSFFPTLPLKRFQFSSDSRWPSLVKRKRVSTLCTTISSPQFGLCTESIYQHDPWKEVFNKDSVPLSSQKAYLHCMYHYQFRRSGTLTSKACINTGFGRKLSAASRQRSARDQGTKTVGWFWVFNGP